MADVTRFPRYHQAENIITNHVMVMFRMIYQVSPKLLEDVLQAVCGDEITVGPRLSQQIAGSNSVPDGLIAQEPLAVFIETKLGAGLNADQLKRHCQTIADRLPARNGSFLIALSSGQATPKLPAEVVTLAQQHGIQVKHLTFGELVEHVAQLATTDISLREVIQEFTDFIYGQGLVPREGQIVVGMLTGTSWQENLAHGVYYEPTDRNPKWQRAAFLGLYHDRQISHVGRILTAVSAMEGSDGKMHFDPPEKGTFTAEQRQAVEAVIASAQDYYPGLEKRKHRFYVTDAFSPTDFRKKSAGGMMGHRYFDIEEISGTRLQPSATGAQAAQALSGYFFE